VQSAEPLPQFLADAGVEGPNGSSRSNTLARCCARARATPLPLPAESLCGSDGPGRPIAQA